MEKYREALISSKKSGLSILPEQKNHRYEPGSLAQRLFDPFATAKRDHFGTLQMEVHDSDLEFGASADESKLD